MVFPEQSTSFVHLNDANHDALRHAIHADHDFWVDDDEGLYWKGEEKDWMIFDAIGELIDLDLPDDQFNQFVLPFIQDLLEDSPLFQKLLPEEWGPFVKKDYSQVEPDQRDNQFAHILRVLRLSRTNHLTPLFRKAVRWMVIAHDIGKIFGAKGVASRFHAVLSSDIFSRYFYDRQREALGENLIEKMLYVIRYHHTLYELATNKITKEEAELRWREPVVALLFYQLCVPDTLSVPENRKYKTDLDQLLFELHPLLFQSLFPALAQSERDTT
jgi:hypothetical protein